MSDELIDVSIGDEDPQLPVPGREIHTKVSETPNEILGKIADWATNGKELQISSKDGLRHLLSESRDRASMFMSVLAMQRMKRVAKLVEAAEDIQETLLSPERISLMETPELIQTMKLVQAMVKENIEFVNKSTEDATTGAQILINMVDARSLTLSREDVPSAQSRESIRHAVAGLLDAFGMKNDSTAALDSDDDDVVDASFEVTSEDDIEGRDT